MALTSYNGRFSIQQTEVARYGMPVAQPLDEPAREKLEESAFMQQQREQERVTSRMTGERDARRLETDPEFDPQDSDFSARCSFNYDTQVNYYRVLGVDEYATRDEIKQAYRRLSLIYHPDKAASLPEMDSEERSRIFIEIKNAYLTLSDQATRRQYDRDRDSAKAGAKVNSFKARPDRTPFDAKAALQVLEELALPEGKTVILEATCRLEKFFYGGHKRIVFKRIEFGPLDAPSETAVERSFWLHVPHGAAEGHHILLPHAGDRHPGTLPDSLEIIMCSRPHEAVTRSGLDLHLQRDVLFPAGSMSCPYISTHFNSVRGRNLILWGRNPFWHRACKEGHLQASILGEGLGEGGGLFFRAIAGREVHCAKALVRVTAAATHLEFHVSTPDPPTLEDVRTQIAELLLISADSLTLSEVRLAGLQPSVKMDAPQPLYLVPMPVSRARKLLDSVVRLIDTDDFHDGLRMCSREAQGQPDVHEKLLTQHWQSAAALAAPCGYATDFEGLRAAMGHALWVLDADLPSSGVRRRLAKMGFLPRAPATAKRLRRRPKAAPPYLAFLLRNNLGPERWQAGAGPDPGSETDPDAENDGQGEERVPSEDGGVLQHGSLAAFRSAYAKRRASRLEGANAYQQVLARSQRRHATECVCEVELKPVGARPIELFTRPPMFLRVYSNLHQRGVRLPQNCANSTQPEEMFAFSVSCPSGSKRSGRQDWERARATLWPVMKRTIFLLLRECRTILPRQLSEVPAFEDGTYRMEPVTRTRFASDQCDLSGESSAESGSLEVEAAPNSHCGLFDFDDLDDDLEDDSVLALRRAKRNERQRQRAFRAVWRREQDCVIASSLPAEALAAQDWKRLAAKAVEFGDYFSAQLYFSREAGALREEGVQSESSMRTAAALSNRCHCLQKLGDMAAAMEDARAAASLVPEWVRPWERIGEVSGCLGPSHANECYDAWFKAVELHPSSKNIDGLLLASRGVTSASSTAKLKADGDEAMRCEEHSSAVAMFVAALGQLSSAGATDEAAQRSSLLLACIIKSNLSGALARLRHWQLALRFADEAVLVEPALVGPSARLAVACLGCGLHERAYCAYANACYREPDNKSARRGREVCLSLLPLWSSVEGRARQARFAVDCHRPRARARIYSVSDLFFDKNQEEWAHNINPTKFLDDVLIIAGNVAGSLPKVERALRALRPKFRRLFYVPGNRELWTYPNLEDHNEYPDAIAKLLQLFRLCDRLDVDVFPASIAEDVFVVPLLSWYSATFDIKDPFPNPDRSTDNRAVWPVDAQSEAWKYMMSLNERHLAKPYHGTVVTFSHFAPRASCKVYKGLEKYSGCLELDTQVRNCRSSVHVYGHTHARQTFLEDGVHYINHSVGPRSTNSSVHEPIMCVFNGQRVCADLEAIS